MPWTEEDASKHIKDITPKEAKKWTTIANSVLASCQKEGGKDCEGMAVRIANAKCKEPSKVSKILAEVIEHLAGKDGDGDDEIAIGKSSDTFENEINKYIRISKVHVEKRIVTGIVLEPERVDLQGDIYDADTIEESAHNFLKDVRQMGVMHKQFGKDLHVVESYIAPVDFELEGKDVKKGTWLLSAKVVDDKILDAIKNNEIMGFSIGAVAQYENL